MLLTSHAQRHRVGVNGVVGEDGGSEGSDGNEASGTKRDHDDIEEEIAMKLVDIKARRRIDNQSGSN